jgi:hypothetical protein
MSIDAVFDGDYESAIIVCENMYIKNKNRKVRVHFGMYNKTIAYYRYYECRVAYIDKRPLEYLLSSAKYFYEEKIKRVR